MKMLKRAWWGLLLLPGCALGQVSYPYFAPGGALSCAAPCSSQIVNVGSGASIIGTLPEANTALAVKPAVTVVATSNQALSGLPTVDGQATAAGSVILNTAQSTGAQNGPWVAAAGAWARPAWYTSGSTTQAFQFVTTFVRLGTLYQGTTWRLTTANPITVDTTATTWAETPLALNAGSLTGILPSALGGTGAANAFSYPANDTTVGASIAVGVSALAGLSGSAAFQNTAMGYQSMKGGTVTGTANAAFGYDSMAALTSGNSNTAHGWSAAQNLTSGNNNAAFGWNALWSNQTGNFNDAFGHDALEHNTASGNSAFGEGALFNSATGANSTCMGESCLLNYTGTGSEVGLGAFVLGNDLSGTTNTALGYNAAAALTTGSNNVFLGANAGQTKLTTGNSNLLIGSQVDTATSGTGTAIAIGNNAVGNQNGVSLGNSTGALVTSGQNNILIGGAAGSKLTTGSTNTIIGYLAASSNLQTGSNDILIGPSVDTPGTGISNMINIGGMIYSNDASTAAPAVTACGTGPTIDSRANNRSGTVTVGTVAAASCTVTFAGSGYASWNHCRVTSQSVIASFAYSYTKTVLTVTGTSLLGDVFDYDCDGY